MTQACPNKDELLLFATGDQTENRAGELGKHIADCSRCQSTVADWKELQQGVAVDVPGVESQKAIAAVMRKIRLDESHTPHRGWLRGWHVGLGSALAAATAVALFVTTGEHTNESPGTFQARGASTESELARKVGADFYAMRDNALTKLNHRATIDAAEGLTLSYVNAVRNKSVYMLAFVVDSGREIHWLYPAYTDASADPAAIELRSSDEQVVLPDTVQLEDPAAGDATLIWIAATERRPVSSIEKLPAKERTPVALQKQWPEAEVGHVRVRIER